MRRLLVVVFLSVLICSCGTGSQDQGARLVKSSDQPCADKVALALNSSRPVAGAWDCFDDYLKSIYSHPSFPAPIVVSDEDIAGWVNPTKYMEIVKFVGHRALYDTPPYNASYLLYRIEGHPNGQHIVGYQEIEIDPDSELVHSETTTYCKPQGDLICSSMPI
jgi:hypothetical protein